MKKTFKTSMALLAFVAAFAMIFTGCKKDDSSSSSGNGGGGGGGGGQYGSITVGDQHYSVAVGIFFDDPEEDMFMIDLFDRMDIQHANEFGISLGNGVHNLSQAVGAYNFTLNEPLPSGSCYGGFVSGQNYLSCVSGSITISAVGSNYKIEAEGVVKSRLTPCSRLPHCHRSGPQALCPVLLPCASRL